MLLAMEFLPLAPIAAVAAAAFGGASCHAACNLKPRKGRRH